MLLTAATQAVALNAADSYLLSSSRPPGFYNGGNRIHTLPENVQLGQLENGLQVMLVHIPTSSMSGVNVQVRAGSMYEDFHTSGMSHMLEHLLFNGTSERTQTELYDEMDAIGGYNNANTAGTYVNYMVVAPAGVLTTAMDIQSDMLFNSTLPPGKFEKERGIVLEELIQNCSDQAARADRLLTSQLYAGSSMAMPVLGTASTIEHMNRDEVYAFYRNFYRPNNMQLAVVGSFDPDSIWTQLERYYGAAPPGKVELPEVVTAGPILSSSASFRWLPGNDALHLAFNAPAYGEPDYPAFEVLLEVLAAGDSPLRRALTEAGIPLTGFSQQHLPWLGFSRLVISLEFGETVDFNQVATLVTTALEQMAREFTIDEDLIPSIVNTRLTEELRLVERPHNLGMFKGDLIANAGFESLYRLTDQIQQVTAENLQRAIHRYLVHRPFQALATRPPAETEADADRTGETQRLILAQGSPLIVHDRGASDLFALHLLFRHRSLHEPEEQAGMVNLLHEMLLTADPSSEEDNPQQRFDRWGIIVKTVDSPWIPFDDYYTNSHYSFIRIECRRQHAGKAVELISELLYERDFNNGVLEEARGSVLGRLGRDRQSPRTSARQAFKAALLGTHPSTRPLYGTPAGLATIDLKAIERLREIFFDPANIIFSVVSALPAAEIAALLDQALPRSRAAAQLEMPSLPLTETAHNETIPLDSEQAFAYLGYVTEVDSADALPLQLLGSIISNRLAMDLRETRGWAYAVGAWCSVEGDRAQIGSYIGTRRENLEAAVQELRRYITEFDPGGITPEELDTAREGALGRLQMRLLSSIGQAYNLGLGELEGDFRRSLEISDRYREVTLTEVKRAARYLGSRPIVEVIAE